MDQNVSDYSVVVNDPAATTITRSDVRSERQFYTNIDGLTPGQRYYVRILATNDRGDGPYAATHSAIPRMRVPGPPTAVAL